MSVPPKTLVPSLNSAFGDRPFSQTEADQHFLSQAFLVAKQSDDPKARIDPRSAVGAVIVRGATVLAASANRLPPQLRKLREHRLTDPTSPERYTKLEHAERAAIFDAVVSGQAMRGTTMYCTRFPCAACARAISWVGIERFVVAQGFSGETRWIHEQRSALAILRDSGVKIRYLKE